MLKFTIITATFNSADTLTSCLDSVKGQSVEVEHVLIDGGSNDETLKITDRYQDHLTSVVSEPDQGIYDAMNKGIRLATGDLIGILNADDFYPENDVLAQVAAVFSDPMVQACYGDLVYVDSQDTDKITRHWRAGSFDRSKMYWGWMPPHPTFFVRTDVYRQYGLFDLDLGTAADYEIMLRFLQKHQINVAYIPRVLVHMRTGGVSNATLYNRLAANRMDRKAWAVNDLRPYPWTLALKPLRKVGQWVFK